jgi:hypothetical protein
VIHCRQKSLKKPGLVAVPLCSLAVDLEFPFHLFNKSFVRPLIIIQLQSRVGYSGLFLNMLEHVVLKKVSLTVSFYTEVEVSG